MHCIRPHIIQAEADSGRTKAGRLPGDFLQARQVRRIARIKQMTVSRIAESDIGGTERILRPTADIMPM